MSKMIITPLGTVSPYSKGNMNCPGFLIEYGKEKILLDCGNGITRLLNFPEDLQNLNVIITHYHKDHCGDIGAIQYASYVYHKLGLLDRKVKIFLPKEDYEFTKHAIVYNSSSYVEYIDIENSYKIGDLEISFKDNGSHSIQSYMVKLQTKEKKLVYTSDVGTTNFNELVDFCLDANLIISESSFLKRHNSLGTTHLTAYDAGLLAKLSNADKLLLTHFWPEEDKNQYLQEAKLNFDNVLVANEGKKLILK